jgi:hypothetical protein
MSRSWDGLARASVTRLQTTPRCQQPMQSAPLMTLFHLFSPVTHPSSTLGSILLFHLRQGPKNPSPLSAGRPGRSRTVAQPAVSFTHPCWRFVATSDLYPAGGLESGVVGNRSCLVARRLPVLRTPVESRRIWNFILGSLAEFETCPDWGARQGYGSALRVNDDENRIRP